MIRSLHIGGFGPLRDVNVELAPLTVFVGRNDAGKSMLLRAVATLGEAGADPVGWHRPFATRGDFERLSFEHRMAPMRWRAQGETPTGASFEYEVELTQGDVLETSERLRCGEVEIRHRPPVMEYRERTEDPLEQRRFTAACLPLHHAHWQLRGPADPTPDFTRFQQLLELTRPALALLSSTAICSLSTAALRCGYSSDSRELAGEVPLEAGPLEPDGRGLPDALAALLLRDRDVLGQIEERLRVALEDVKSVNIHQIRRKGAVHNELEVVTTTGTRVPAPRISDGLLLYLAYLYLALGPHRQPLLLIEEPEKGLHPGMLERVVELLRSLTKPEGEHEGTQVLVVTHSPILLDFLEPEEIRVVTRVDGATRVEPFSEIRENLARLLEYLGPGEIWTNFGKDFPLRRDELDD